MADKKKTQKVKEAKSQKPAIKPETTKKKNQPELKVEASSKQLAPTLPAEPIILSSKEKMPVEIVLQQLMDEIEFMKQATQDNSNILLQLQEFIVRKRKSPITNGKVQIKDTKTGKIYPSKNNVYQSLLKAGELKELVDKGIFGKEPEKNSFGCYVLFRQFPGRFVEVKSDTV